MNRFLLSVVAASTLMSVSSFAANDLASAFKEGKTSGQIRAFYINRDIDAATDVTRDGLALGGKIAYETAPLYGISAGVAFYTTNKLGDDSSNKAENDLTLFKKGSDGYPESTTYLGQAYLQGKFGNTVIKAGRQQLDTPLAGSDDTRMLPNLFEAAVVINSDIKDTTLIGAHVTRIAYGTFANAYSGGVLALVSGYGATGVYKTGEFQSMSKAALGDSVDNSGVTAGAIIYKGIPNLSLQVWDYYAYDILNAIYAQADFSWKCLLNKNTTMTLSAQYINEKDVGDKLAGNVDSNYYGVQLAAKNGAFNAAVAYSVTTNDGHIITPWGGMPAFTQGMVTRHQFFADTTAWKVSAGYNLKDILGQDITASAYYASFDVDSTNGYIQKAGKTTEPGFDIIYNNAGIKNLQLRLRGNFPDEFGRNEAGVTTSWSEYRVIANYNF